MDHQERIREAYKKGTPLRIRGGGSKGFLLPPGLPNGEELDTRDLQGIRDYQPEELFIRAGAGTPLKQILALLHEQGQTLAFDPPTYSAQATLGGCVATGLSGPGRPWLGSVRDFVLGCVMVNGKGERLHFGGEVIKNVAGYDVSRLQCGAWGSLGLLEELSIKTLPLPEQEISLVLELDEASALEQIQAWNRQPLPLSGATWYQGRLHIRLSGSATAVAWGRKLIGGEPLPDNRFWKQLRELELPFFREGEAPLWRLSLPRDCGPLALPGDYLLDWGGAQRWLRCGREYPILAAQVEAHGGHLHAFHAHAPHPLNTGLAQLHERLKQAFDPAGLFNPGLLLPGA